MKKLSLNKIFAYLLLSVIIFGCASFPKKKSPSISYINSNNIYLLEGTYSIKHSSSVYSKDSVLDMSFVNEDNNQYLTLFDEINNGVFVKRLEVNSLKSYKFSLKILSTKRIQINYLEDDSLIRRNKIRYKLKEEGYVNLKHRNFKIIGIPYVMGGFKTKRKRLALTKDNDLLFETSEFTTGGVFYPAFIVPAINFGSKTKYKKIYQRINQDM
ncbi:hypothetical protein [Aestuariivivens sediminis]|uniref:hypothetical protein n=1 Tax=Aestuariivivens sediminis TaxID=2913557 RepID=UPI001F58201F|nr:hypothetical protein [Aestuariivivens sediminis]